jgi:hypothetical protein
MKKGDIDQNRISRPPDRSKVLLAASSQKNQGYTIRKIELRQYIEHTDERLGDYSLLMVIVETDKGAVEMKYDEGFRGPDAFESAVLMLTQYVGLASLINRALIELQRQ